MNSARRLAYRLAAHHGFINVDTMLECISFPQLLEWAEYAALELFGEERQDWRFAKLAAELINFQRDRKKHPAPVPVRDFLLRFAEKGQEQPSRPKQSWEEQKSIAQMWVQAYSGDSNVSDTAGHVPE